MRAKRPAKKRKLTRGQMGKMADKLFSLIVRRGGDCEYHDHPRDCRGTLQCAHIVSRAYRSTRWKEANAVCLCQGAHKFFTHHQLEWEAFVISAGHELNRLKTHAMEPWDGDLEGVLVRLAARAVALGIKPEGKAMRVVVDAANPDKVPPGTASAGYEADPGAH
jgi:hypothetical protein